MSAFKTSTGYQVIEDWMRSKEQQPFNFQYITWEYVDRWFRALYTDPGNVEPEPEPEPPGRTDP